MNLNSVKCKVLESKDMGCLSHPESCRGCMHNQLGQEYDSKEGEVIIDDFFSPVESLFRHMVRNRRP